MEIPGHEILRLIGHGGMATVYLARQTSLGREVVLKILDTAARDSPQTVERFLNEGRLIASLQHPHIITIYDISTAEDNIFISMEYVKGGDLKSRLQHHHFQPLEALDLVAKIGSALGAAHAKGIVHRDVKPGNVLFREDGTPLLSDFGIAKNLAIDADLTTTGMFLGSPNYMAPEQSATGSIDHRVDIYSLGVILYEMLTGEKPYNADSVIDVIYKHKKEPIPKLPAGLEAYQDLLNLMMAKDRNHRFRDVHSLLHFIAQLSAQPAVALARGKTRAPDAGAGGTQKLEQTGSVTRIELREEPRPVKRLWLLTLLGISLCVYGSLLIAERLLARTAPPSETVDAATLTPVAPEPDAPSDRNAPGRGDIAAALVWLGRHSLNEYRLTAPPRDNAYYYFSRLRQIEPDNPEARAGLIEIAARYAILAETEIANDNFERARSYVAIGLQLDPANQTLNVLHDLTEEKKRGFGDTLAKFLGR